MGTIVNNWDSNLSPKKSVPPEKILQPFFRYLSDKYDKDGTLFLFWAQKKLLDNILVGFVFFCCVFVFVFVLPFLQGLWGGGLLADDPVGCGLEPN